MKNDIPEKIKTARADEIMALQQEISMEHNRSKTGKIVKVIIDKETEDFYIGRTEFDSPDVDNEVLIKKTLQLKVGTICSVKVIHVEEFDLYAEIV